MRRAPRAGVLLLLLVLAGCQQAASDTDSHASVAMTAAQVERGRYLLRVGDCQACHTRQGGEPWAGGRAVPTPFGIVYSPNITPDATSGIGAWDADDFWQALHFGKAPDGRDLYPAFPYDAFTQITRADSDAMFAALAAVAPVVHANRPPELAFPYDQRWLLGLWRALFFEAGVYQHNPDKSAQWNRGAYLVQGLGHCGACHTPRNALGARDPERPLAGAMIAAQDWYASNLHTGARGGLHGWSSADIVALLKTGHSRHGSASGPMQAVVSGSTQYLSAADAAAVATWLLDQPQSLPAVTRPGIRPSRRRAAELVARGQGIYRHSCAACHGEDGRGKGGVYPSLVGNPSLRGHPVNAIRAVLLGGFAATTRATPRPYSMPPFAPRFSDAEVAAVVSYIRDAFADGAPAVSPQTVVQYRSTPLR